MSNKTWSKYLPRPGTIRVQFLVVVYQICSFQQPPTTGLDSTPPTYVFYVMRKTYFANVVNPSHAHKVKPAEQATTSCLVPTWLGVMEQRWQRLPDVVEVSLWKLAGSQPAQRPRVIWVFCERGCSVRCRLHTTFQVPSLYLWSLIIFSGKLLC